MSALLWRTVASAFLWIVVAPWAAAQAEDASAIEKRLADSARSLASDEMEGRGVGTKGLDRAAECIAAQFSQSGLKANLFAGSPYQKFAVTMSVKLGANNRLALVGPSSDPAKPQRIDLKPGEDFNPLALGGSATFDLPLVFAGYGITGPSEHYDDYAGLDAGGKAVVILRHQPQQGDPKSVFGGTSPSQHAAFARKVANAADHRASAVVFVSDGFDIQKNVADAHKRWQDALDRLAQQHAAFKKAPASGAKALLRSLFPARGDAEAKKSPSLTLEQIESQRNKIDDLARQVASWSDQIRTSQDPVLSFDRAGRDNAGRALPVVYCRRSVINRVLQAVARTDLAAVEKQIDSGSSPRSRPLDGWRVVGQVDLERTQVEVKNVVAVCEAQGPAADQTIVVGAHYDHLGFGRSGAQPPDPKSIRHGADDNASGVAVMIEVARTLGQRKEKLGRRVVFVAFAGEEMGLLGSQFYVNNPSFPLDKTVAMVNLDMVGRLRNDKLTVGGSGSAAGFSDLLDELNRRYGFQLTKSPAGFGPSDQLPFYGRKLPVMHFFTGLHEDYHRPSDQWEKLNLAGMRRIAAMVADVVVALANGKERPQYVPPAPPFRSSLPFSRGLDLEPSLN
jgi:hypothetical protein